MEIILIALLVLAFPMVFVCLLGLAVIIVRYAVLAAVFIGLPVLVLSLLAQ